MLVDAGSSLAEDGLPSLSTRRSTSPMVVGAHGGAVMLSSRAQPRRHQTGSLFPDEEHSYEPRRQVRFASLRQNALPYSERAHRPRLSPPKSKVVPPPPAQQQSPHRRPSSPAVQLWRKKHRSRKSPPKEAAENQRAGRPERVASDDDPESRTLWGFSVRYSPKRQLEAQWRATKEQHLRALQSTQEEDARQREQVVQSKQRAKMQQADYAQYLHLASRFGPLDALLYCCCPEGSHGRIYVLLVEISARRLQRWAPKRVAALRRFWVGHLAREVSDSAQAEGIHSVGHSFQQQHQATALCQRLKLVRAARALRAWRRYTERMVQLREKMRLALAKDLDARFRQWRESVGARVVFRRQLKHIARRKAMHSAFEQWQVWRTKHEKLRCYLMQQWLKAQQECWAGWRTFVRRSRAAKTLQRSWRLYDWRTQRRRSCVLIGRVYRGWKARQRATQLRHQMEIHRVVLRLASEVAWGVRCELLTERRALLLERRLVQAKAEVEYLSRAEEQAAADVEMALSKVVRNDMHRKLEEQVRLVKLEAVTPLEATNSSNSLRRLATQRLVDSQRALARREAVEAFRASCSSYQAEECVICEADRSLSSGEDVSSGAHHECLRSCDLSVGDSVSELRKWEGRAREELAKLGQSEQRLRTTEPSIASVWQAMAKVPSGGDE